MTDASLYRKVDRVIAQRVDGTVVLLHLDDGRYFALDEVGARFWELLDGQKSLTEVARQIAGEYREPRERVEQDLVELVSELTHERLVEPSGK